MKKKYIIIICIVLVILIGLIIGGIFFVKSFNKDRENTLVIMDEIQEKYKSFSPLVEKFSDGRTDFYTSKDDLFYLETVDLNRYKINTMMENYNALVMDVYNNSKYLQENCNRKYSKSSVNNTCDLFKQGYEAVMNYYLTDINMYNTFVKEYNAWLTENEYTIEPLEEETFSLYENYIDYDKDGNYLGGE